MNALLSPVVPPELSPVVAPVLLVLGLVVSAVTGPVLLRRAAPALVRLPRLAVAVLAGGALLWLVALLALGPMVAWFVSGPALLPSGAAEMCERCVASANPFDGVSIATVVPVLPFLALPVAGVLVVGGAVGRHLVARDRVTRATWATLAASGRRVVIAGHRVLLVPDARPVAFTLPRRHGGIVVSDGALRALARDELAAVLAHEEAHLRQRHHLVRVLVEGLARPLRWVPFVAAAADAVPQLLEIAADNAARRHAGTPALAAALLKLGTRPSDVPAPGGGRAGAVLHAAGPDRIRHLVAPARPGAGAGSAVAAVLQVATLAGLGASIHAPYLGAVLSGCA